MTWECSRAPRPGAAAPPPHSAQRRLAGAISDVCFQAPVELPSRSHLRRKAVICAFIWESPLWVDIVEKVRLAANGICIEWRSANSGPESDRFEGSRFRGPRDRIVGLGNTVAVLESGSRRDGLPAFHGLQHIGCENRPRASTDEGLRWVKSLGVSL